MVYAYHNNINRREEHLECCGSSGWAGPSPGGSNGGKCGAWVSSCWNVILLSWAHIHSVYIQRIHCFRLLVVCDLGCFTIPSQVPMSCYPISGIWFGHKKSCKSFKSEIILLLTSTSAHSSQSLLLIGTLSDVAEIPRAHRTTTVCPRRDIGHRDTRTTVVAAGIITLPVSEWVNEYVISFCSSSTITFNTTYTSPVPSILRGALIELIMWQWNKCYCRARGCIKQKHTQNSCWWRMVQGSMKRRRCIGQYIIANININWANNITHNSYIRWQPTETNQQMDDTKALLVLLSSNLL